MGREIESLKEIVTGLRWHWLLEPLGNDYTPGVLSPNPDYPEHHAKLIAQLAPNMCQALSWVFRNSKYS